MKLDKWREMQDSRWTITSFAVSGSRSQAGTQSTMSFLPWATEACRRAYAA